MAVPLLLFAHGAGAGSTSAWMQRYAEQLGRFARVERFDYPYMASGRRTPDPLPRLLEAHRAALQRARAAMSDGTKLGDGAPEAAVLIGKSMGGRVGCHLALTEPVAAVVCLGYPLRAAGTGKLRDQVLRELRTPVLFVQGTEDPLCPLSELERVRGEMHAPNALMTVEGGNHSLEVGKRALQALGTTQTRIDEAVCRRIAEFVAERAG